MSASSPKGHQQRRHTKAEMDSIREDMVPLSRESWPLTVRELFYLLVLACLFEKLESEYKQIVGRLALTLRKSGEILWDWVVDRTRWYSKPTTYSTLEETLEATAHADRRAAGGPVAISRLPNLALGVRGDRSLSFRRSRVSRGGEGRFRLSLVIEEAKGNDDHA
jgi:hypothetical protein